MELKIALDARFLISSIMMEFALTAISPIVFNAQIQTPAHFVQLVPSYPQRLRHVRVVWKAANNAQIKTPVKCANPIILLICPDATPVMLNAWNVCMLHINVQLV